MFNSKLTKRVEALESLVATLATTVILLKLEGLKTKEPKVADKKKRGRPRKTEIGRFD